MSYLIETIQQLNSIPIELWGFYSNHHLLITVELKANVTFDCL